MGAYECWCMQKPKLRLRLKDSTDGSSVINAVRHTFAQVEQNTMAEKPDALLRQQTGILFSCAKASLGFLDVSAEPKIWELKTRKKKRILGWLIAVALQAAIVFYGYVKGENLLLALSLAALLTAVFSVVQRQRESQETEGDCKVTLETDVEKLFQVIDAQMQSIDRNVNDFAYLNETAVKKPGLQNQQMVTMLGELLEALCECDLEESAGMQETVEHMLSEQGLLAVTYTPETRGWFSVLPSKSETRTMVPALVTREEKQLVKRGVAAVVMTEAIG